MRKARITAYISPELEMWYKQQAEEAGATISSMIAIALNTYREQRDAMRIMGNVLEKLEKVADKPGING